MASESRLLNIATIVLAVCAVTITALVAKRELFPRESPPVNLATATEPDWQSYAEDGHVLGDIEAPVTIVEFADFECGYCKRFQIFADSLSGLGYQIRIVYRHYPVTGHRFAIPAVWASECAAAQGRFSAMHAALFSYSDSFGIAPWSWFADRAGVPDIGGFEECTKSSRPLLALHQDTLAANRLGITGTPLLLIGDLRVNGLPSFDSLRAYVERAQE